MGVMIAGVAMFLGVHLVPVAPRVRADLVMRLGERRYRGLFALVAAAGLALIVAGWVMRPENVQVFAPLPAARAAAPALVTIAFVLFAAANMRTHIRRTLRHPMLIGLMLWSGVHLLANGDLAGTILFGSFLVYSIVALVSAAHRNTAKIFVPEAKHDLIAIAAGVAISFLTIYFHPALFGTAPVA
jgi:uncharacterized membrane protein